MSWSYLVAIDVVLDRVKYIGHGNTIGGCRGGVIWCYSDPPGWEATGMLEPRAGGEREWVSGEQEAECYSAKCDSKPSKLSHLRPISDRFPPIER